MPPATRRRATKKATARTNTQPWRATEFADQAAAEQALAALKRAVVAKVRVMTRQHGWCNEANRAMVQLGLVEAPKPVTATYTIEVNADTLASMGWENFTRDELIKQVSADPHTAMRYGVLKNVEVNESNDSGTSE